MFLFLGAGAVLWQLSSLDLLKVSHSGIGIFRFSSSEALNQS